VNVFGVDWKGRHVIEFEHERRHRTRVTTVWANSAIDVQLFGPEFGLVHVKWARQGDLDLQGVAKGETREVFTGVVVKQKEDWFIRAAQNTNIAEVPTLNPAPR
jgi:hypothetical protein